MRLIMLLLWMLCAQATALAMTFTVDETPDGFRFLHASGPIHSGDGYRLEKLVQDGFAEERVIVLSSPGGDLFEGLEIAHILNFYGFQALVVDACSSACFFAFTGAEYRQVADGAELGTHQFAGEGIDAARAQSAVAAIMLAFDRYGIDKRAATVGLLVGPDDIHVFSREELADLGLERRTEQSFAAREAAALGITEQDFRQRRAAVLDDPRYLQCLQIRGPFVANGGFPVHLRSTRFVADGGVGRPAQLLPMQQASGATGPRSIDSFHLLRREWSHRAEPR